MEAGTREQRERRGTERWEKPKNPEREMKQSGMRGRSGWDWGGESRQGDRKHPMGLQRKRSRGSPWSCG